MSEKNQYEITAAETKSIGFDFQYYYFLLNLLRLRAGQTLGLEVKDDIHIDLPDGSLILLQLKHTVQTKADGSKKNMAERDIDLWKTLNNWIKITCDESLGRKEDAAQIMFLEKTQFILVSNKSNSANNNFFTKLSEFKSETIKHADFITYLKKLLEDTEDSDGNKELRNYIISLIGLKKKVFTAFLKNVKFNLDEDNIIEKIKIEIEGFMIPPEKVNEVYSALNSSLRDNIYLNVKTGNKISISHREFLDKYRNCFGRMKKLPIRKIEPVLPNDCASQPFIKQLIDIGDVGKNETDRIIGYTKMRLSMYNNMAKWIHLGELTAQQKKAFEDICIQYWDNSFRTVHRKNRTEIEQGKQVGTIEVEIIDAANQCLAELRKIALKIEEENLEIDISNGQFYQLSDELRIGWHLEWKNKYKLS